MTIQDWLIERLQAEMNGPDVSLVRIEQLTAAFRDIEVGRFCSVATAGFETIAKTFTVAESLRDLLTKGPQPPPAEPTPCAKCGNVSVLERIVDGVSERVCAEHVEG